MPDTNNQPALPDGGNVAPAGGGGTVPDATPKEVKDVLSQALNKPFPTNEAAIAAVKDTFSAVGWAGKYKPFITALQQQHGGEEGAVRFMEQLVRGGAPANPAPAPLQGADPSKFVSKEQYDADTFFAGHPELANYRGVIENVRTATGKSLAEVIKLPEVETLMTKAKGFDEAEKTKSVLHTSPRIGQITDKVTQSREALKQGDRNAAVAAAIGAVKDAYEGL